MDSLFIFFAILIALGICALIAIFQMMKLLAVALMTLALLALIGI